MVEHGDRWLNELDRATPPDLIEYVLHLYDIILVMTVNHATAAVAQA
jgi:hypothetical protein